MLAHVAGVAVDAVGAENTFVVTPDDEIETLCDHLGVACLRSRRPHPNGVSRLAEQAGALSHDFVINLQGDEPLMTTDVLHALIEERLRSACDVVTCIRRLPLTEGTVPLFEDPNRVKVVADRSGRALYFSRAAIPHGSPRFFSLHLGVYAYTRSSLLRYEQLDRGALEGVESLEQLRLLEHGLTIQTVAVDWDGLSVDTKTDLERVEQRLLELGR